MEFQGSQDAFILIILFGVIAYLFLRGRRRKRAEDYKVAYIGHSAAATAADPEFRATFGDMLPDDATDACLLRISLMNRSDVPVTPEEFLRPVSIILPEDSRVLQARAAQSNSAVTPESVSVTTSLNRVEIAPFALPNRSSMIFNIVIDGAADPYAVDGALQKQDRLEPLK
ncbi:MAG: hypothetical protein R8L07_06035 [Alphaproteobacteria bacterium]|nr:hypothetical protein [Alphaproteobacteria bacterium]